MSSIRGRQYFIGTVDNINMAALIYDIVQIQATGSKVKANLTYTKLDVLAIICLDQVYDETKSANH